MRSVFVEARQWLDKTGGNTYFSARVHIDGKLGIVLPFQYGYGSFYEQEAMRALSVAGLLPRELQDTPLWRLRDLGIDVYSVIYEAKQRDVKRFGKAESF
jgi:hypothetical protein